MKKGLYKHFKGTIYQVLGVANHSEDLSEYVVYINPLKENDLWIRPKAMFEETIVRDGKEIKRFEFILDEE